MTKMKIYEDSDIRDIKEKSFRDGFMVASVVFFITTTFVIGLLKFF